MNPNMSTRSSMQSTASNYSTGPVVEQKTTTTTTTHQVPVVEKQVVKTVIVENSLPATSEHAERMVKMYGDSLDDYKRQNEDLLAELREAERKFNLLVAERRELQLRYEAELSKYRTFQTETQEKLTLLDRTLALNKNQEVTIFQLQEQLRNAERLRAEEIQRYTNEIAALQQQIAKLQQENAMLRGNYDTMNQRIIELEQQLRMTQEGTVVQIHDFEARVKELMATIDLKNADIVALQNQIASLQANNAELQRVVKMLEQNNLNLQATIDQLRANEVSLVKKIDELNATIANLMAQLQLKDKALQDQANVFEQERMRLEMELNNLQKRIEQISINSQLREEEIKQKLLYSEEKNFQLSGSFNELKAELAKRDDEFRKLQRELSTYATETGKLIKTYDDKVLSLQSQIQSLMIQLDEQRQLNQALINQVAVTKQEGEEKLAKERAYYNEQFLMLKEQIQAMELKLASEHAKIEELNRIIYGLRQQLDVTNKKLNEALERIAAYEQQIQALNAQLKQKEAVIQEQMGTIMNLKNQLELTVAQRNELERRVKDLELTINEQEAMIRERDGLIAQRDQYINQLQETIRGLEAERSNLLAQIAELQARLDKALNDNNLLQQQLRNFMQQMKEMQAKYELEKQQLLELLNRERSDKENLKLEISHLVEELKNMDLDRSRLLEEIERLRSEKTQQETILMESKIEVEQNLRQMISEKTLEIVRLSALLKNYESQIAELLTLKKNLERQVKTLEVTIQERDQQLELLVGKIRDLESKNHQLEETVAQLQITLSQHDEKISGLEIALANTRKNEQRLAQENAALLEELKGLRNHDNMRAKELEAQLVALKRERQNLEVMKDQQIQVLLAERNEFANRVNILQDQIREVESLRSMKDGELIEEYKAKIQGKTLEIQQLREALANMDAKIDGLSVENADLKQRLSKATSETEIYYQKYKDQIDVLSNEKIALQQQITGLERQFNEMKINTDSNDKKLRIQAEGLVAALENEKAALLATIRELKERDQEVRTEANINEIDRSAFEEQINVLKSQIAEKNAIINSQNEKMLDIQAQNVRLVQEKKRIIDMEFQDADKASSARGPLVEKVVYQSNVRQAPVDNNVKTTRTETTTRTVIQNN